MLKAGADLSNKNVQELISLDSKVFEMGSHKVEIAQVNAVDPNDVLARRAEIEEILIGVINQKGLDLFLFVITDILTNDSIALAFGEQTSAVEQAFNVTLVNQTATLKGVVSRKKQVVPVLTNILNN
jgi:manganese-dependent inorganic pyrophosphatase